MNEITLDGCTPTPLANYLKALGVLRLLSTKHPETRGFWRGDKFILHTKLDEQGIADFFLNDYEPTPIMAPWNGGSGFFEKDNKDALRAIQNNQGNRFALYRQCLDMAETALEGFPRRESPKGDDKARLLTRIRASMPEEVLDWLDAAVLITADSPQYPPLLGTGGNDGRLDFTNNFMQRLGEVMDLNGEAHPSALSDNWLQMALFAKAAPNLVKKAIGQFSPGQAGGPNASTGFDADAAINPWDFVLMIEGALVFAVAAVRRNANDAAGILSYPFTVRAMGAGSGSLGEGDTANARGELWMPLWPQPASFAEVRALMAEGRVALNRMPTRDALDFVRAVHHMGGYRGVRSFQRFGLLMRSGKAYLATPLSRVEVTDEPRSNLLDELDKHGWLDHFRQFARGEHTANRFKMLGHQLEDRLFTLSGRKPAPEQMQSLLVLLGDIQKALAMSSAAMDGARRPIPRLSEYWTIAANDHTPAFRIAKALAGLRGTSDEALPLRAQLFPVHRKYDQWTTPESGEKVRIHTNWKGRLVDALCSLLTHRLQLAERLGMKDKPLTSPAGASLDDVTAFLQDDHMDARIAALLPGLCLCTIPEDTDHTTGEGTLPAAFGLMKLALTPDRTLRSIDIKNTPLLSESEHVPIPAGLVAQLAAGNHDNRAVETAWRRLRASGLAPLFPTTSALPTLPAGQAKRAAAALLIPLRFGATASLARTLLAEPETETIITH
ncbi:MAG TPA: type I-U CRISPR-associated protein Csx17 [Rhodanobacteraceae bacterium]|nr:type I-U CRISPR-associated protein Csx17 [Rhodanobacteraceae bacterium]